MNDALDLAGRDLLLTEQVACASEDGLGGIGVGGEQFADGDGLIVLIE